MCCVLSHFSHVQPFVTTWTIPCQAPLSMEFSRQEHWSGLPCLFQEIFLTQGSNPGLLCLMHCRQVLYYQHHLGSSIYYYLYICTSSGYVSKEMKTVI